MNKGDIRTAQTLTYAGVLPFLLLSLAVALKIKGYDYDLALRSYGAVIVSFLCGVHWAVYIFFSEKSRHNLLLHSNAVALIAWGSLLFHFHGFAYLVQCFCFIYLLSLDYHLLNQHVIPIWYFKLRQKATGAVSLLLIAAACIS